MEGEDPQKIASDAVGRDIRLYPDWRRIVFTSGYVLKETWVMQNFLTALKPVK